MKINIVSISQEAINGGRLAVNRMIRTKEHIT